VFMFSSVVFWVPLLFVLRSELKSTWKGFSFAASHLFNLHLFREKISDPFHESQQQSNYVLKPSLQQSFRSDPSGDTESLVFVPSERKI
jgi:hypothetical protein